uniref:Alpha-carbonic anhydrase domain-containing protein n=1 Tax=Oryzias sinensis TaxID=183150 RepID=A0A8C7WZX1_9TELE
MEGSSCGDNRQSPIDIQTSSVKSDPNLDSFIFQGFDSTQVIKSITNNGHTVTCELGDKLVNVSGGGLNGMYNVLQFHFHWGKADFINHPGSEHTVDGNRYPMEVKNCCTDYGFIYLYAKDDQDTSEAWTTLTSFLPNIEVDQMVNVDQNISINGLIGNVDLSKYYRYMGSLTTPQCSEAVVWTLFHEPIPVTSTLWFEVSGILLNLLDKQPVIHAGLRHQTPRYWYPLMPLDLFSVNTVNKQKCSSCLILSQRQNNQERVWIFYSILSTCQPER